ncbi:hypothetical protein [Alkalihalobacterium sp. APHAB7]|uniref:hypothetical protein n=1 Tax=Alkalihalobacterium sp. APHAB7 TaxID=3402081 RepID=UPI003AB0AE04
MNNWFVKKALLLIVGHVCISSSSRVFPSPFNLTFSEWLGELVFSPFSLLGATLLFIVGFMALAFVIKGIILGVVFPLLNKGLVNPNECIIAIILFFSVIIQSVMHPITGVLAGMFATAYGIMEANEGKVYDRNS